MASEEDTDLTKLLAIEQQTSSNENDATPKTKATDSLLPKVPILAKSRIHTSPGRRRPLDYSVDDSQSFKVPEKKSQHYPRHPPRNKRFAVVRWVLGVAMLLCLFALSAVGIALILTSSEPGSPWWTKSIIYQCYPQSFQDSNRDGIGDLEGIRSHLSYFSDIGVQAVWLNPIFQSPQKDNGYDISNYTAINKLYGTLDQFKALLDELHDKGLHLLLDFVPNHTSDQHAWFNESRANKTNSKRDWYVWANGRVSGGAAPPNNWISVFGGSAWTYDNTTDQWYLHQFSSFQPDLNYTNQAVREAMIHVLRYWLEMGVDGFRVDAVKFLLEDPKLRNETDVKGFRNQTLCSQNNSNPICYDSLIHNLTTDYPGIHNITREWKEVIDEYSEKGHSPRLLIGEVYDDIDTVMKYYGENGNEFNFPFNFFLLENTNWTGNAVACIVAQWMNKMPFGGKANWVLGNHDNPRIASKAGVFLARALNVLLLTLPGAATTYYGEEILMTDVNVTSDKQRDKFSHRDAERTPMQWNTSAYAGFTFPNIKPWLPLAENYTSVNVEVESANKNRTSMLQLYKTLASLRSSRKPFSEGNYTCINATEDLFIYLRHTPQDQDYKEVFLVAINFSSRNITTTVNLNLSATEIVLSSFLDKTGKVDLSSLYLRAGEGLIVMGTQSKGSCQKVKEYSNSKCNVCNTPLR